MASLGWKLVAIVALLLAGLGTALPFVPALPFLLLAALAAGRGWPWLERRLTAHPALGPLVAAWREHGALPRSLKCLGVAGLVLSAVLAWLSPAPAWAACVADLVLLSFGAWLWSRPSA